MATSINVYDFDYTVYNGDCSLDFYFFCLRKKPTLIKYLPFQFYHFIRFALKLDSRTAFKSCFFIFVRDITDIESKLEVFWASHFKKIKDWYLKSDHKNDVIISASPSFLLAPAGKKLHVKQLIATEMDLSTGMIIGQNCRGAEKVVRLLQSVKEPVVVNAYSDSLADMPLLSLAQNPYIVKRNKITKLQTSN